jgi:hypothetical protein
MISVKTRLAAAAAVAAASIGCLSAATVTLTAHPPAHLAHPVVAENPWPGTPLSTQTG